MSAFDQVIGMNELKAELQELAGQLRGPEKKMRGGVKLPCGLLLHGQVGMGKTLLAKCFAEESGRPTFTVRGDTRGEEFLADLNAICEQAIREAPSILCFHKADRYQLDGFCDSSEMTAIVAAVDRVKSKGVFVILTADNLHMLPHVFADRRRFDNVFEVSRPKWEERLETAKTVYASQIPNLSEEELDDFAKMTDYRCFLDLESIVNEAKRLAEKVGTQTPGAEELKRAILKKRYGRMNADVLTPAEIHRSAVYEAARLTVCETLRAGCVGIGTICSTHEKNGLTHRYRPFDDPTGRIAESLAGIAALELLGLPVPAELRRKDYAVTAERIRTEICAEGLYGPKYLSATALLCGPDTPLSEESERMIHDELVGDYQRVKELLSDRKDLLNAYAEALEKKKTLLASDIQRVYAGIEMKKGRKE